ncbi:MAG: hypothetical protein V8R27_06460 [Oscillospiraceae bacterium]
MLTLDANVQLSLENGLENMLKKYDAKNGGTGIVMDVNTGAIIAMASYPNYDLNDYGTIFDAAQKKLNADSEKINANRSTYESEEAYAAARAKGHQQHHAEPVAQWGHRLAYEPLHLSSPLRWRRRLKKGKVSKSSTFYCGGYTTVPGWSSRIWCSNHSGHGQQTLIEAVGHSCNPALSEWAFHGRGDLYRNYLKVASG